MPYQQPELFMVSLKVLIKNRQGEFLLLESPDFIKRFGTAAYDLPGGRINDDEVEMDIHKLLKRELNEELGDKVKYKIKKSPVSLMKTRFKDGRCIMYILFEADYLSGKITISDEHIGFKWQKLTPANLKKYFRPDFKFNDLIKNYFAWN